MTLIEEIEVDNMKVKFYDGIDFQMIYNHPKDGSNGILYFFIERWENEKKIFDRNNRIGNILNEYDDIFDIDNIENNYIVIYQTNGNLETVFKVVKDKLISYSRDRWYPSLDIVYTHGRSMIPDKIE